MRKRLHFLRTAISDRHVGAVTSSSKYVVKRTLKNLERRKLKRVVEYGPGNGVMTKELLKRLPSDGRLLAVELNKNFVNVLNKISDQRLRVILGKIQDIAPNLKKYNISRVDAVVSSIPFSLLSGAERDRVTRDTFNSLAPGGSFTIFHQYSRLMRTHLEDYFKTVKVSFEPRNILPCFIIHAQK